MRSFGARIDEPPWRVYMKPSIPLIALLISACAGSSAEPGTTPTGPTPVDPGEWGRRTQLIAPNSVLACAELTSELYLPGGYPAGGRTARTVELYDIASDRWELGPPLPQPNNPGMATSVKGKIYLIG